MAGDRGRAGLEMEGMGRGGWGPGWDGLEVWGVEMRGLWGRNTEGRAVREGGGAWRYWGRVGRGRSGAKPWQG